ncbi:MAG: phosphatase PAP2 family protein [Streptosporangiales bacterium]|nr:phosphatase PAP2 family protein [Streptosporangiales bacterium]
MEGLWRAEISLVTLVQDVPSWLGTLLRVVSELGVVGLYLAASAVLYWCVAPRLGIRIALLMLSGAALYSAFKLVTHAPRPYWFSPAVLPYGTEPSFGLPSGHATTSASAWGLIVARAPAARGRVVTLALAVVALVGLSRVYLGVHFPTDVLGGWLLSFALLAVFIRYERPVVARWRTYPPAVQILLALVASSLPLLIAGVADAAWQPWAWPAGWNGAMPSGDLGSVEPVAGAAGGLLGVLSGLTWLGRRGGYRVTGTRPIRLARLATGIAGAALIWFLTGLVPGATGTAGEYVRYALEAFWVTAGAPLTFAALGLREREQSR